MTSTAWTETSRPKSGSGVLPDVHTQLPKSGYKGLTDFKTVKNIYDPNGIWRPSTSRTLRRPPQSAARHRMQSAPPKQVSDEQPRHSLSEASTSESSDSEETSFDKDEELPLPASDDDDAKSVESDVTVKPSFSNKVYPAPEDEICSVEERKDLPERRRSKRYLYALLAFLAIALMVFLILNFAVDKCWRSPCQNGGECTNILIGHFCTCAGGFEGIRCQYSIDECLSDPCFNNGTCIDDINRFNCTCGDGYNGTLCENDIDECASHPCQNAGTCTNDVNFFWCLCAPGYTGQVCQLEIDECRSDPCYNGGSCTNDIDSYNCTCADGFNGTHCEDDIDECASDPCQYDGTCVNLVNRYWCVCTDGYTGPNCQENIDECLSSPCENGTCVDGVDEYTCTCQPGYSGDECNVNFYECGSSPCQNGGTCLDGINQFECFCEIGYGGYNCGEKLAIDLIVVIDTSGSMNSYTDEYEYFLSRLLCHYIIDPVDFMQVAVVAYELGIGPAVLYWNLQSSETESYNGLLENILTMKSLPDGSGLIEDAFQLALTRIIDVPLIDRPATDAKNVVLTVADGGGGPIPSLQRMKNATDILIAVLLNSASEWEEPPVSHPNYNFTYDRSDPMAVVIDVKNAINDLFL